MPLDSFKGACAVGDPAQTGRILPLTRLPVHVCDRKCVGDQFALMEAVVALAVVLRRFTFRAKPGHDPGMTTGASRSVPLTHSSGFHKHPQHSHMVRRRFRLLGTVDTAASLWSLI